MFDYQRDPEGIAGWWLHDGKHEGLNGDIATRLVIGASSYQTYVCGTSGVS